MTEPATPDTTPALAADTRWRVDCADCLPWLASLPADSVSLIFTSPPYERCRTYLENGQDLGIARSTDDWVAWMLKVCEASRRVCVGLCAFVVEGQTKGYRYSCAPFLLIADLHRTGFHLRKPPIYQRHSICGSGGPDWLRNDYEPVICFTRGGKLPWSDNTAMGHSPKYGPGGEMSNRTASGRRVNRLQRGTEKGSAASIPAIANPGNVIDCGVVGGGHMGNDLAHENEAPFPEDLVTFFVRSFCPPGGIVCDPFSGSGTTGAVAVREGRRFIGCDLRPSQVALARKRISGETPSLFTE